MTSSTLKALAAIAISTTACVSFAQQATDANAAGANSMPPQQQVDPATGAPTGPEMYPTYRTAPRAYYLNRSCSGLSERQSERACRQGYPVDHAAVPNSRSSDRGGPTDDQAD